MKNCGREQDKDPAYEHGEEVGLDWTHTSETSIQLYEIGPNMEPMGEKGSGDDLERGREGWPEPR
jgi:hypothetical protein